MGDRTRGLYGKFYVERTDGKSAPGEKHHGCEYYVLDLMHDKYAVPALRAYAEHCQAEYPLLAAALIVAEIERLDRAAQPIDSGVLPK